MNNPIEPDAAQDATSAEILPGIDVGRLSQLFEDWPHAVFALDRSGHYVFQNAVDRAAFGNLDDKGAEDVAADTATDEDWTDAHRRVLAGETLTYSVSRSSHSAATRDAEVTMTPIRRSDTIIGILGMTVDRSDAGRFQRELQTALSEAQDALAELKAYDDALDQMALVVITDATTFETTYVNDRFCSVSGWGQDEVIGRPVGDLIDSDENSEGLYREIRQTVTSGRNWFGRVCNKRRNGELYWVLEATAPQRSEDGTIVAYVSIGFEITDQVLSEQELKANEARYRLLAHNSSDVIILSSLNGKRTYFSPAVRKLTGYTPEEALAISIRDWVHPDDLEGLFDATAKLSTDLQTVRATHRIRRKDGTYVWVEGAFSVANDGGQTTVVATIRDVTQRKAAENEYRSLFDHSVVGLYRKSMDGNLLRANRALAEMRGYPSEDDLVGAHQGGTARWRDSADGAKQMRAELMRNGVVKDSVYSVRSRGDNEERWVSETAWLLRDENGDPQFIEGMVVDITERMAIQSEMERRARFDSLTELPNRFSLREAADRAIKEKTGAKGGLALVFIDLDRFKAVNDTLGHSAGDDLLRQVAKRVKTALRPNEFLARLGGDEFAVLLPFESEETRGEQIAVQVISSINHPVRLNSGQHVTVGASVGVAQVGEADADAEEVLRRADLAMYQAKRAGRNAFRTYSDNLDEEMRWRQNVEAGLRRALERDEFHLVYQPKFKPNGADVEGFEALLRWTCPDLGSVSPAQFIPVAEEAGLMVAIGDWVIKEAIAQAAVWPEHIGVAINASVQQLRHSDFAATVLAALSKNDVSADRIEVEVTESVLLDGSSSTLGALKTLQDQGVRVALDDFGTGWSSLSYLNRHQFDRIKIDRSFVQGLSDLRNEAIITAIVGLCESLGTETTAEGVETAQQLERIVQLGCHEVQGFLLGKPMKADDATALCGEAATPHRAVG